MLQALSFGGLDTARVFEAPEELTAAAMGVILAAWSREMQVEADDEARWRLTSWMGIPDLSAASVPSALPIGGAVAP